MENRPNYVAIDIAKDSLQIQTDHAAWSAPHTAAGHQQLLERVQLLGSGAILLGIPLVFTVAHPAYKANRHRRSALAALIITALLAAMLIVSIAANLLFMIL